MKQFPTCEYKNSLSDYNFVNYMLAGDWQRLLKAVSWGGGCSSTQVNHSYQSLTGIIGQEQLLTFFVIHKFLLIIYNANVTNYKKKDFGPSECGLIDGWMVKIRWIGKVSNEEVFQRINSGKGNILAITKSSLTQQSLAYYNRRLNGGKKQEAPKSNLHRGY